MTHAELTQIIVAVLNRAPEWIRADLQAKDLAQRKRAEEALAIMIAAAIAGDDPAN